MVRFLSAIRSSIVSALTGLHFAKCLAGIFNWQELQLFGIVSQYTGDCCEYRISAETAERKEDRMCPTITIFGLQIQMFSLCFMMAGNTAFLVFYHCPRYPEDIMRDFLRGISYGMLMAVAGGKLLFAITQVPQGRNFLDALLRGGFVFYGGLIGGAAGLAIYCRKSRQNYLDWADILCSLLPLCQAIGRIGCFCNGCCYGKPYSGVGSVLYPVEGVRMGVYPTWFMESFGCAALFLWLWNRPGRKIRGSIVSGYLTGYGILRFCIEFFRGDEIRGVWGLLSTSQMISIVLILAGVGTGIYAGKCKEQNKLW